MTNDPEITLATRLARAPAEQPTSALLGEALPFDYARVVALLLQDADAQTRSDPGQALSLARRALEVSAQTNGDDPATRAACLAMLGHAYRAMGQHSQSVNLYDQAAHNYRLSGRSLEAARTRLGAIASLMYLGRTTDALTLGRRLRRVFARHGAVLDAAKLEANLAIIHARLHRPRRALVLADSAAASFGALGEDLLLAQINVNRANMLTDLGDFRPALDAYTAARTVFAARDMRSWTAKIDVNIGFLYAAQGHYYRALRSISAASEVFASLNSPRDLATANLDLADVYLALNLDAEASALAAEAAATFAAEAMPHDMARALLLQARAMAAQGDDPRAILALLEHAASAFTAEGYAVGVAMVQLHQAALLLETDPHAALGHITDAEPVLARHRLIAQHGQCLLLRARSLERVSERRAALSCFSRAERLGARYGLPWLRAEALHGAGRLRELHDPARARQAYEAAIEATESMRAELQPDEMRISFVRGRLGPYEDLLRLLLRMDEARYRDEAFLLVERARSRALLDMLAGDLDVVAVENAPASDPIRADLHARISRLREELNWHLSTITNWRDDARQRRSRLLHHDALHTARSIEDELHSLLRRYRLLEPADAARGSAPVCDAATVQKHLAPRQALVEYTIVGDEVLAFVVGHDTVTLVRNLCSATEIRRLIDRLYVGVQRFNYGEEWAARYRQELQRTTERHLATLGQALLAPLADALSGYDRLVIAPHGPLHYLPFHALRGPYGDLLDTHETVVIPSASVWVICQERLRATPKLAKPHALVLGVDDDQTPQMAREAQDVGRLFAHAEIFTGSDASVATLYRRAPDSDLLHLACHGRFRGEAPLFSSLRLADGWLTVHDIYALRLRAQLVTLSGCQTGQQSIGPGDDLVGLARGFFSTGVSQLIVSLWMVNDASTSAFMEQFYAALSQGQSAPAAARVAQRALRDRYHHPYYWAPFVSMGAS